MNPNTKELLILIGKIFGILVVLSIIFIIIYYSITQAASSSQDLEIIKDQIEENKKGLFQGEQTTEPLPTTEPPIITPPTYAPVADGEFLGIPEVTLGPVRDYCGENQIIQNINGKNVCVFYPQGGAEKVVADIVENLKNENKILVQENGLIVRDEPLADLPSITKNMPDWMQHWLNKGGYNASNLISGENTWGEGVNCDCGDCAAWRGGNTGSCNGYNKSGRGKTENRRVACDINYDKRRCVCAYPFVPINGLCVNPFKYKIDYDTTPVDGRPCCPPCVYNGTCVGIEQCKGECEQNLVELPGVKYNCTDVNDTEDTINITNKNCTIDTNVAHGINEYECAVQCTGSQLECSKRCLPKLWVWQTLTDGTNIVGYRQTDKLVQFEDSAYSLNYCPIEDTTCKQDLTNISNSIDDRQNCFDCTGCKWVFNNVINEYTYDCDECKKCTTKDPLGEEDGYRVFNNIECQDNTECIGCGKVFDPVNSRQNVIGCNYCKNGTGGCVINNINDPQNPNINTTLSTYNQGDSYKPNNNKIWEDFYRWGDFSTAVGCSAQGRSDTCATKSTEYDGGALGWFDVYNENCTAKGACNVPVTFVDESKPVCYGTVYYDQLDEGCEKLILTDPTIDYSKIDYNKIIKYGVATGLPEEVCKDNYCKVWDWDNKTWEGLGNEECAALCTPYLYKNFSTIPEYITTGEQIDYLFEGGKTDFCYSGRYDFEFSGDCTDIPKQYSIPSGITSSTACSTNTVESRTINGINCKTNTCPTYAGGFTNSCGDDSRSVISVNEADIPQRQTCTNDNKCVCAEGTCPQNGICLSRSDNTFVKYGIARGLPEWQCPYYYCKVYDRTLGEWVESPSEDASKACAAICLPEVYNAYNSIPDSIKTTKEQVDYLTESGFRQPNPNPDRCDGVDSICSIM